MRTLIAGLAVSLLLTAATAQAAKDGKRPAGHLRTATPVFVLDKGRLTAFDAPGAGAAEFPGANNRGQIVGTYTDMDGALRGYLRDVRDRLTTIDAPGAQATSPIDINNRGVIVGNTCAERPCQRLRGFLRDTRGRFTAIGVPGSEQTQAFDIDDRGTVVGGYVDGDGGAHGFTWSRDRVTTVDVPGAVQTMITAVNDRGETAGLYLDTERAFHGFFRSARGRVTPIDAPDVLITLPLDLNNRGQIVGITTTAPSLGPDNNEVHGFLLAAGEDGPFTRIDIPGATDTGASAITDRRGIVGLYQRPTTVPSAQRGHAYAPMKGPLSALVRTSGGIDP
jgi:hypothetical protein